MAEEVWVPVIGFEGLYEVSNNGRLKSLDRVYIRKTKTCREAHKVKKYGKIIATGEEGNTEYPRATLVKDRKNNSVRLHRIVYCSFNRIPLKWKTGDKVVCHKNDIPFDCSLDNLFLGTSKENTQDMVRKGRGTLFTKGQKNGKALWSSKKNTPNCALC